MTVIMDDIKAGAAMSLAADRVTFKAESVLDIFMTDSSAFDPQTDLPERDWQNSRTRFWRLDQAFLRRPWTAGSRKNAENHWLGRQISITSKRLGWATVQPPMPVNAWASTPRWRSSPWVSTTRGAAGF